MFYLSYQDYLLKVFLKVFAETKSYVGDRETTWQEFVKTILKEKRKTIPEKHSTSHVKV